MSDTEEKEGEEESEQGRGLVANIKGGYAYSASIELPPELQKRISEIVEQKTTAEVQALLPKVMREKVEVARGRLQVDSTTIGSLICSLISLSSGYLGIQQAMSGNLIVAEALIWVMLVGIVGLAILLYARATAG